MSNCLDLIPTFGSQFQLQLEYSGKSTDGSNPWDPVMGSEFPVPGFGQRGVVKACEE